MRRITTSFSCFAFMSLLAVGGCTPQKVVQVADPAGTPIAGAYVEAHSPSIITGPSITNSNGEAVVPDNIQGTNWIAVSKAGYERIYIEMPDTWPLQITLQPSATP